MTIRFFVEMDAAGETEEYESVEFDDVDFCQKEVCMADNWHNF